MSANAFLTTMVLSPFLYSNSIVGHFLQDQQFIVLFNYWVQNIGDDPAKRDFSPLRDYIISHSNAGEVFQKYELDVYYAPIFIDLAKHLEFLNKLEGDRIIFPDPNK